MRRRAPCLAATATLAAALLAPSLALAADRVAVLRFDGNDGKATPREVGAARAAARDAVGLVRDTLPSDTELAAGEAQVTDGTPDTTREYRAAGTAAGTSWTIAGHVESHGWTYRLELEACQVSTGRVESLVREIDARQPAPQIAEMLALLLRPEGVGGASPPWEATGGPGPARDAALPSVPAPPTPTPAPLERPHDVLDASRSFGAGLGVEVLGVFARAASAGRGFVSGSATVHLAEEIAAISGFAVVAEGTFGVVGQTSSSVDLGGRYLLPVGPSGHLRIGPELGFGAYFLSGAREARLLSRGEIVFALSASAGLDVEVYPETALAAGGAGSLWFAGGGARAVLQF
jgi:hypothetical protein